MSESDDIATPLDDESAIVPPVRDEVLDEEDRLRPRFVRQVLDAVADGDDEAARAAGRGAPPGRHRRPDRTVARPTSAPT